jgi:charged multivesicular body protein 6
MLGGVMSAQDEDEVEEELAALEAEYAGKTVQPLPNVPNTQLPTHEAVEVGASREEPERQAMLA